MLQLLMGDMPSRILIGAMLVEHCDTNIAALEHRQDLSTIIAIAETLDLEREDAKCTVFIFTSLMFSPFV